MASLFAQPYISPPDYETVKFSSSRKILLVHQSAVNEYERYQKSNAEALEEDLPQQVDAGGMTMMNNSLRITECAVELKLRFCVQSSCS
jgi:hypothetical protein